MVGVLLLVGALTVKPIIIDIRTSGLTLRPVIAFQLVCTVANVDGKPNLKSVAHFGCLLDHPTVVILRQHTREMAQSVG